MDRRPLGSSDLLITRVGVGTWAMGGANWQRGWGPQDDRDSVAAICRALELGANWIDTAAVYGLGHAETIVARARSAWRGERPLVFTKCGLRKDATGRIGVQLEPESIRRECEESLRRLAVDAIDLYQVHRPPGDPGVLERAMAELAELQRRGWVRWIGVSNFGVDELACALRVADVASLQPPYSLLHREIEEAILPFCEARGLGVLAYSPLASGLLTGTMTRERIASLPDDDWRKRDEDFTEPRLTRHLRRVEELRAAAARDGRSPAEAAIAWVLKHPAVTGAIVGVRTAAQADGVMQTCTRGITGAVYGHVSS